MDHVQDMPTIKDDGCSRWEQLFISAIDTQKELIILMHNDIPVLFNQAFKNFVGMSTVKEFLREFGSLQNRFVPHSSYFHAGKAQDPDKWIESLVALPENERIVSMFDARTEPYAFAVTADISIEDYAVVSFTDISQDFIKRIMIENDVSIDKESGAYDKDYFIHTAKSFYSAAEFNQKFVAITMIELISLGAEHESFLRDYTLSIKSNVRQSDMVVRWDEKVFLLAYLTADKEDVIKFSEKLLRVMSQEPFDNLNGIGMRAGATIQNEKEEISSIITRAQKALEESSSLNVVVL